MQVFDRCFVFRKGTFLGMLQGGTLEGQGDPLPVDTMGEELAGVTPVPKHFLLSSDSFIPSDGFQADVVSSWLNTEKLTYRVQFGGNGKAVTFEGFDNAPTIKYGAADHTMISWRAIVKAAPFR